MITKLLNKIFGWTLTVNMFQLILRAHDYLKDWMLVSDTLKSQAFHAILRQYLQIKEAKQDWLGRVYGVTNPNLTPEGEFDFSHVIFEMDGINSNTNTYIENWLYKQMITVSQVFSLDKTGLLDILTVNIEHVGPKTHDNYLIVFDIASRQEMSMKFKRVMKQLSLYAILAIGIYIVSQTC